MLHLLLVNGLVWLGQAVKKKAFIPKGVKYVEAGLMTM